MLKALELLGFKSFPDKTRFEFPPGITVVVGPNGSGKSNIVDAMKWVLGEQSARSLRGKEMADVIFKGSAHSKRKPANTAEATIIFDNSSRLLPIDETEVHVTRRVYRSGEGEYLINGDACRLRDIKDLFRGTGVGTDAYSLIEQGKVDSMLRASPKDRRAIFEEAAGISRFKAKKVDAQRRLERVEQNLLRLSDIVEEVGTRLKRVKSQASKAQRFKEHNDRLQSLRTQVGRVDWQRFTEDLALAESETTVFVAEMATASTTLETHESQLNAQDAQVSVLDENLRACEARASQARERKAACESVIEQQNLALSELTEEADRIRSRLVTIKSRAADLTAQLEESQRSMDSYSKAAAEKRSTLEQHLSVRDELTRQVHEARVKSETQRESFVTQMRQAADLGNRITAHEAQLQSNQSAIRRTESVQAKVNEQLTAAKAKHAQSKAEADKCRQTLDETTSKYEDLQSELTEEESSLEKATQELAQMKERQAALVARASVLEEIEQRLEGVGSGVKQVLDQAKSGDTTYSGVRGMVADIIQVIEPDKAMMVETALGMRAEHLVVAGQKLFEHLESSQIEFPGRVGFLRLQSTPPPTSAAMVSLDGHTGVIGRADRFVQTTSEYEHLVSWLLRDTWFVETISDAIQFHRSVGAPIRLVTKNLELLDRDGRLLVGPLDEGKGIISRRAELRQVNHRSGVLKQELVRRESELSSLGKKLGERHAVAEKLASERQTQFKTLAKLESKADAAEDRVNELKANLAKANDEFQAARSSFGEVESLLTSGRSQLSTIEGAIKILEATLSNDRSDLNEMEQSLEERQRDVTEWEVVVAKSEQRLDALQTRRDQLQLEHDQRQEEIAAANSEFERCKKRREEAELNVLSARSESSEMALVDEECRGESDTLIETRNELRTAKKSLGEQVGALRNQIRTVEQRLHARQLESEKLRHQRDTLASRLEEDYGISVTELGQALSVEAAAEREQVDEEIESLRRKISNLGAVNLDALNDLNELDSRFGTLQGQYDDLIEAKEALEKIITKINADSRRLFSETLEVIRENFGRMFRKVFGGGSADIVLEEGVDILESGIDIVATPPGKHSLALSLLSGGERALTAVTLLLAIFEYRPSPFCVLDEVDGPLDEANIGRFVEVLREFLKWTKFVVVTHSKRTMTAANTLYGVTMQESGVSKRVAVRFEDVSEGGRISEEAIRRSQRGGGDDGGEDDERGAA